MRIPAALHWSGVGKLPLEGAVLKGEGTLDYEPVGGRLCATLPQRPDDDKLIVG